MPQTLESIKKLLAEEGYTCVLSNGEELITSREKGVKPLVQLIDGGRDFKGFFAADRTVGKAAALLYAYMGVTEVYAFVASEKGADICRSYGIKLSFERLTENIINRTGDDICPMEKTVAEIDDPKEAVAAIKGTMKRLTSK